ncbi:hypothetical protein BC830DRAFT_1152974, partial [Chytriomyces sp. MP71]
EYIKVCDELNVPLLDGYNSDVISNVEEQEIIPRDHREFSPNLVNPASGAKSAPMCDKTHSMNIRQRRSLSRTSSFNDVMESSVTQGSASPLPSSPRQSKATTPRQSVSTTLQKSGKNPPSNFSHVGFGSASSARSSNVGEANLPNETKFISAGQLENTRSQTSLQTIVKVPILNLKKASMEQKSVEPQSRGFSEVTSNKSNTSQVQPSKWQIRKAYSMTLPQRKALSQGPSLGGVTDNRFKARDNFQSAAIPDPTSLRQRESEESILPQRTSQSRTPSKIMSPALIISSHLSFGHSHHSAKSSPPDSVPSFRSTTSSQEHKKVGSQNSMRSSVSKLESSNSFKRLDSTSVDDISQESKLNNPKTAISLSRLSSEASRIRDSQQMSKAHSMNLPRRKSLSQRPSLEDLIEVSLSSLDSFQSPQQSISTISAKSKEEDSRANMNMKKPVKGHVHQFRNLSSMVDFEDNSRTNTGRGWSTGSAGNSKRSLEARRVRTAPSSPYEKMEPSFSSTPPGLAMLKAEPGKLNISVRKVSQAGPLNSPEGRKSLDLKFGTASVTASTSHVTGNSMASLSNHSVTSLSDQLSMAVGLDPALKPCLSTPEDPWSRCFPKEPKSPLLSPALRKTISFSDSVRNMSNGSSLLKLSNPSSVERISEGLSKVRDGFCQTYGGPGIPATSSQSTHSPRRQTEVQINASALYATGEPCLPLLAPKVNSTLAALREYCNPSDMHESILDGLLLKFKADNDSLRVFADRIDTAVEEMKTGIHRTVAGMVGAAVDSRHCDPDREGHLRCIDLDYSQTMLDYLRFVQESYRFSVTHPYRRQIPRLKLPVTMKEGAIVFSVGQNDDGQLGIYNNEFDEGIPCSSQFKLVGIPEEYDVVKIAAGGMHVVALTTLGQLVTWGAADFVGRIDASQHWKPELLNIPAKFVDVTCGECFTAALDVDGKVWAWGSFRVNLYVP